MDGSPRGSPSLTFLRHRKNTVTRVYNGCERPRNFVRFSRLFTKAKTIFVLPTFYFHFPDFLCFRFPEVFFSFSPTFFYFVLAINVPWGLSGANFKRGVILPGERLVPFRSVPQNTDNPHGTFVSDTLLGINNHILVFGSLNIYVMV
jgi:hypothetical protein